MEKTLYHRVRNPLIGILIGVAGSGLGYEVLNESTHERTRRAVQISSGIDINNDRVIGFDEWTPVYEFFGMENTGKYGIDLTSEQLEQYLDSRKGGKQ